MSTGDFGQALFWENLWDKGTLPWQMADTNPVLVKHYDAFTKGRKNLRILVPFCGKTVDMLWLADRGHTVTGVDLVESGVRDFFVENKLEYEIKTVQLSGKPTPVYKAKGKEITIFVANIFDFSSEAAKGRFDGIWERGGITSIGVHKEDRGQKYVHLVSTLLSPEGRYLLVTFRYSAQRDNPPSNISEELFQDLFGGKFDFDQVAMLHCDPIEYIPCEFDIAVHLLALKPTA